jgi:lysophospholipase L1-like esterase
MLFTIVPELALRTIGFHYVSEIAYGSLRPQFETLFEPDDDLFWKYPRIAGEVNSLGFRDREVAVPKDDHVKRLLFLGDSCTDQGFAHLLESVLNSNFSSDSVHFECVVLAVPGYSSYQGKVLARKYGKLLQADIAFVFFGWNDHWLTYGRTDNEIGANAYRKAWTRIYYRSRLLQAAEKVTHEIFGRRECALPEEVRVPKQQYRENLEEIDSIFCLNDVPVVLITAPSAHSQLGVPTYLIQENLAPNPEFVIARHREYNDIVREVARRQNAHLLDLEREFRNFERPERLFRSDGIHFSPLGLQAVSFRIYEFLTEGPEMATWFPNSSPKSEPPRSVLTGVPHSVPGKGLLPME